jgi:putative heme-binding domain-containing protein
MSRCLAPVAVLLCAWSTANGQPLSPAGAIPDWIWLSQAKPNQNAFFRKHFESPANVTSAKLVATCDNQFTLYIDGKEVASGIGWESPVQKDVSALFVSAKPAKHVIAVRGRNTEGAAGLLARITFESKGAKPVVLVTDSTWKAAEKGGRDWQSVAFDDASWKPATAIGKLGTAPWTIVNEDAFSKAGNVREPQATLPETMKVAKGFKVELLYSVPKEAQGSWVNMCTDPKGRLIVCNQYGQLYRVTPPPADKPEQTKVEPLNVNLGGAHGLAWAFDSLYVMVGESVEVGGVRPARGLHRVRSNDGGETFEKPELLREIAGAGEHGPHAIVPSPDGKSLYIVCGNHTKLTKIDSSLVPQVWKEDHLLPRMWDAGGHAVGIMAPGGWIARTDPDGKKWELVSMGYRNQFDAAFNRHGDLFTFDADMEWDFNTPWYRPTRVCLASSGSEFGWRSGTGKWPAYYPDSLPSVVDIGPGSPTGVCFGYGAKFPAKYQEAFFICDWSYGKLYAVHMSPDGSAYKGEAEEFVSGSPLPLTDVVVNPKDGALYFTIGGRKTKSGLYRLTYTGSESTAAAHADSSQTAAPSTVEMSYIESNGFRNRFGQRLRSLPILRRLCGPLPQHFIPCVTPESASPQRSLRTVRQELEKFHGRQDAKAVDAAWGYLGHDDRYIRFAARTAIEFQPVAEWQERSLAEKNTQTALTALLALARLSDSSVQPKLLAALDAIKWDSLTHSQQLDLLRVYGLTFIRMGMPAAAERQQAIARFDAVFPSTSRELNAELSQLLIYLEAPRAATKTMKLLADAPTQEEQLDYVKSLRMLKTGWTPALRKEYFSWFLKAANYRGGNSFAGFVRNIKNEAIAGLTADDRTALQAIIEAKPDPKLSPVFPPRTLVKQYKLDEVMAIVEGGLKGRDFDRGRRLFAEAQCFSCHRFANEGGANGPDLTGSAGRFSVRDLMESIVEPSKVISDQYQAVRVETIDGKQYHGRIVNLNDDGFSLNTNMLDPNGNVRIDRKRIESIENSPISMMPTALLDNFKPDEIMDLVAFLLSRGDRKHTMFQK